MLHPGRYIDCGAERKVVCVGMRRFLAAVGIPVLFFGAVLVQSVFATTYVINDGGRTFSCTLYAASPGEALSAAGVELTEADRYTQEADTITVRRAPTVKLIYHGESRTVVCDEETVRQLLDRLGIELAENDVPSYPAYTVLQRGMELRIDRVESREEIFTRELPGNTRILWDPTLPEGTEEVLSAGKTGTMECRAWVTYVNGVETRREILEEKVTAPASDTLISRGSGPAAEKKAGTLEIGDGIITLPTGEKLTYTKVDYVRATAYTHTDEGCTTVTATGTTVSPGTVAVDPRYIPYGTRMFIVASDGSFIYGIARAEDCGGDIKGDRMDLYMPTYEACMEFGRRRCTVYFLG